MRGLVAIGALLVAGSSLAGTRFVGRPPLPVQEPPAPAAAPVADPDVLDASAEDSPVPPSPATRYASLAGDACLAELDARQVPYARVERTDVETPVRIAGRLSGVRFRTLHPPTDRTRSRYEVCDCRLVLALDDFAKILRQHDIVDVMYYSALRPLVPGGKRRGHESALAIDIAFFGRANGNAYSVLRDFTPIRREHPCTPIIRAEGPREMRAIVCEAVAQGIFHVALTPDYDPAHKDHFHLEIIPGETKSYAR